MKTNETRGRRKETTMEKVRLDANLRRFLRECMSCQSLGIAAWATTILRRNAMTMRDLERCLELGFEF